MTVFSSEQHPVRILGVFAHPDDEIFCAGGTFARYAVAGAEVMVVSATRGEAGQIRSAHSARSVNRNSAWHASDLESSMWRVWTTLTVR